MNRPARLFDDSDDLFQASLRGTSNLQGHPGDEAAIVDGEQDRIQDGFIGRVERTVDEDTAIEGTLRCSGHSSERLAVAFSARLSCCIVKCLGLSGESYTTYCGSLTVPPRAGP